MPNSAMLADASATSPTVERRDAVDDAPLGRVVLAKLHGGASIPIACPAWCTTDHANDQGLVFLEDLDHSGPSSHIGVYDDKGVLAVDPVYVQITQDPFSKSNPRTRLTVTDEDGGRDLDLTVEQAQHLAAELIKHGKRVAQLAAQFAEIQAAEAA